MPSLLPVAYIDACFLCISLCKRDGSSYIIAPPTLRKIRLRLDGNFVEAVLLFVAAGRRGALHSDTGFCLYMERLTPRRSHL